jgi:hypothetical protein
MKNILFALLAMLVCTGANAQEMKFDEEIFDFGKIPQGPMVTHYYKFTNTGTAPLIINSSRGSCGCTSPEFPKDTIAPSQSGFIKVTFNTAGRTADQSKTVFINSNAISTNGQVEKTISFKAFIDTTLKPEDYKVEAERALSVPMEVNKVKSKKSKKVKKEKVKKVKAEVDEKTKTIEKK